MSPQDAALRVDAQLTNEQRAKHGHVLIDTDREREETRSLVSAIYNERKSIWAIDEKLKARM